MIDRSLLVFFGYHKCATVWINSVIGDICRELRLRHVNVHNPRMFNHDLERFVRGSKIDFLSYTSADYEYVGQMEDFRGFRVVRDPRDMCVSAYFSHLYSHPTDEWPELVDHRKKLQALPKQEGLLLDMQFMEHQFAIMYRWPPLSNVLEVKMEKLTQDPYEGFLSVFRFLDILDEEKLTVRRRVIYDFHRGLRRIEDIFKGRFILGRAPRYLPVERMLGIIWENDFARKAGGRQPGQEDVKSHYRKGMPGDWRNHFERVHVDYFKQQYGSLLTELGYEQDSNWD